MSLIVKNLSGRLGEQKILKNINLSIFPKEVHVLMGPNGSGKTTLANIFLGDPRCEINISSCELKIDGEDIRELTTAERVRRGIFLTFQTPLSIPGVNVANLLQTAYRLQERHNPPISLWEFNQLLYKKAKFLHIPEAFLKKSLNEAFSGGEKKKMEMLQALVISPKYVIFDEIDTGLDVDGLKIVAHGIKDLRKKGAGILLITHYPRILKFVKPDFVHVMVNGEIVKTEGKELADYIEKNGYERWRRNES